MHTTAETKRTAAWAKCTALIPLLALALCGCELDGESNEEQSSADGNTSLTDSGISIDANESTDVQIDVVADSGGTVNILLGEALGEAIDSGEVVSE